MLRKVLLGFALLTVSGCQQLPEPVCYGTAKLGNEETTINIFDVKKQGRYTLYKADHHYNWRWVGPGAFDSITCRKS